LSGYAIIRQNYLVVGISEYGGVGGEASCGERLRPINRVVHGGEKSRWGSEGGESGERGGEIVVDIWGGKDWYEEARE
jgi:hypothetical protein